MQAVAVELLSSVNGPTLTETVLLLGSVIVTRIETVSALGCPTPSAIESHRNVTEVGGAGTLLMRVTATGLPAA